jgi:isopenicillin-N epimerase
MIDPLVISWGWQEDWEFGTGSRYLDKLQWWGTYDPTPVLSIPRAIEFMDDHNWDDIKDSCRSLLDDSLEKIERELGVVSISNVADPPRQQMAALDLSPVDDLPGLKKMLYDRYRVEIPCFEWRGRAVMRLSIQAYNSDRDIEVLIDGLKSCIREDRDGTF